MPDPKTFKQHFESRHPKSPMPPELVDVVAWDKPLVRSPHHVDLRGLANLTGHRLWNTPPLFRTVTVATGASQQDHKAKLTLMMMMMMKNSQRFDEYHMYITHFEHDCHFVLTTHATAQESLGTNQPLNPPLLFENPCGNVMWMFVLWFSDCLAHILFCLCVCTFFLFSEQLLLGQLFLYVILKDWFVQHAFEKQKCFFLLPNVNKR